MNALLIYASNPRVKQVLNRRPGDQGFSLIELVVVVAVLAVLAAIAIPAFNGVQEEGRKSAAKSAIATAAKECVASATQNGSSGAAHTALNDGNGLTFTAGLKSSACTETQSVVCVDNATKQAYTINLVNGNKNVAVSTIPTPCTSTDIASW